VKEIVKMIRTKSPNAIVIVDGVAYAAHRAIDVQDMDVDFYAFSFYKTFGPHLAVLYGKKEKFASLKNINHFYITEESPRKIQPGNFPYELGYSVKGINEYLCGLARKFGQHHNFRATERQMIVEAFEVITKQEEELSKKLMRHLNSKPDVYKIIGSQDFKSSVRVPTSMSYNMTIY
jgi:selenocysteine lyase/cysteine desulfurase